MLKDWDQDTRHPFSETLLYSIRTKDFGSNSKPSTRDDTGGPDGPPLPIYAPCRNTGSRLKSMPGIYDISDLDRIRANQAKRAMISRQRVKIIQDNPIVDESITDITMRSK